MRSQLPVGKTWSTFDLSRLPLSVRRQLETLRDGSFLDRRENLLLFGKPGSGKSHALCALSEQLVLSGRSVLFTTCSLLVQQLLIAKRDLRLPKLIKQFSSFEGLIIELNVPSYRVEKAKQAVSSGKSTTDEAPPKNS